MAPLPCGSAERYGGRVRMRLGWDVRCVWHCANQYLITSGPLNARTETYPTTSSTFGSTGHEHRRHTAALACTLSFRTLTYHAHLPTHARATALTLHATHTHHARGPHRALLGGRFDVGGNGVYSPVAPDVLAMMRLFCRRFSASLPLRQPASYLPASFLHTYLLPACCCYLRYTTYLSTDTCIARTTTHRTTTTAQYLLCRVD